jgi:hypothetical protein
MKFLICASLIIFGCNHYKPPKPIPDVELACEAECANLRKLDCPWAKDTPAGATCEQRCESRESTGYTTGYPHCVANAKTCEEADHFSAYGCN